MARRTSPLKIKQQLAEQRERRIRAREPRNDGFLRRSDREPLTVEEIREKSRERSDRQQWYERQPWFAVRHERFIRAQLGADARAAREALIGSERALLRKRD